MASDDKVEFPFPTHQTDATRDLSSAIPAPGGPPPIPVRRARSTSPQPNASTPLIVRPARSTQPSSAPPVVPHPSRFRFYVLRGRLSSFVPSLRRTRGLWLGLAAFAIGAWGEWLLFQPNGIAAGMVIMAVAMLMGMTAWSGQGERYAIAPRLAHWTQWRTLVTFRSRLLLRLLGIAAALGLLGASLAAYWANPNEIFGWQGVLWLLSIALLLVSCARWYPRDSALSLLPRWTPGEMLLFASILAFALLTHLLWLEQYPLRVDPNEYLAFTESMHMYADPPTISMFTTTWLNTSMPSLWFVPEAAFMHLLGTTGLGGVRFWPALVGALLVVPVYLLARLVWGRTEAAISSFAVGFMAVSIHYSRISFPNPGVPLGWAFCFCFILRGLRTRRPNDFVWAGLAAGFSMYTHYSTRLLPFVVLAFLAYLLLFHFKLFREHIGHFLLVPVGYVVGFGPMLPYFYSNPQMWAGRGLANLLIPAAIPTTWDALATDWNILSHQLVQNFLSLSVIPAQDSFYWAPFMFPVEAILVMLGVGVLLWRWRQPASFLVLLWGVGVMFTISLVEVAGNPNPNFAHWSAAHPVFFLAFALPIALCLRSLRLTGFRWWRVGYAWAAAGLLVLALANINFYINIYPALVAPDAYTYGTQGRYLQSLQPDTLAYFVARSSRPLNKEIASIMGPNAAAGQLFNPSRQLPLPGTLGKSLDFVFFADTLIYLPIVQEYYPQGHLEELTAPPGKVSLQTVYHVTAQQAMAQFGAMATFSPDGTAGQPSWQGKVPAVGSLPPAVPLTYPLTATWSGALYLPASEPIQLGLSGFDNAKLWVMGEPQSLATPLSLDAGWVPFSVEVHLASAGASPTLNLREPESVTGQESIPRPVDQGRLWPLAPNSGLALTLTGSDRTVHRIDSFIGSALSGAYPYYRPGALDDIDAARYFASLNLALPGKNPTIGTGMLRWTGSLLTDNERYTMDLRTTAHAQLSVDGTIVLRKCDTKANGPSSQLLDLTAGWHNIQVDFEPSTGDTGLEWLWTKLNEPRQLVPPSRLRFADSVPPTGTTVWPSPPITIPCGPQ